METEENRELSKLVKREIIFSRVFEAPRERVFKAWTSANHIENWWGPNGFTTTTHEFRFVPEGVWSFVMHSPEGIDYDNKIVFHQITAPQKIVYEHDNLDPEASEFQTTVSFKDLGHQTKIKITILFPTEEACEEAKKMGAVEGGAQTLNRLAHYLEMTEGEFDLMLTRRFKAPRKLVFEAWTNPQYLAQWWGPQGFTNPVCEIDPRPNGHLHIDMKGPDGKIYPCKGYVLEIQEPERLVISTSALDEHGVSVIDDMNTITFQKGHNATILTLHAAIVNASPLGREYLKGQEEGWSQSLDRLAEFLRGKL